MAFKDFASGLFGGLGSVVSGAIGAKSTSDTNKTNLKIAQMNNDFNAREAQKARDFQLNMWNRENEYNSASSQRKRLEDAGYNPYMSDAQAGTNFEMDAIGSCFIGGASAYGGTGTVPGVIIGALLMGVLNLGMSIMGIDQNIQKVVKGLVLLAAVIFDVVSKRKSFIVK